MKYAAIAACIAAFAAAPAFAQQSDKMAAPTQTMSDGKSMTDKAMPDKAMPDKAMSNGQMATDKAMNDGKAMSDKAMNDGKMNDMKK